MWKCPKCREELRDWDEYCWNCNHGKKEKVSASPQEIPLAPINNPRKINHLPNTVIYWGICSVLVILIICGVIFVIYPQHPEKQKSLQNNDSKVQLSQDQSKQTYKNENIADVYNQQMSQIRQTDTWYEGYIILKTRQGYSKIEAEVLDHSYRTGSCSSLYEEVTVFEDFGLEYINEMRRNYFAWKKAEKEDEEFKRSSDMQAVDEIRKNREPKKNPFDDLSVENPKQIKAKEDLMKTWDDFGNYLEKENNKQLFNETVDNASEN